MLFSLKNKLLGKSKKPQNSEAEATVFHITHYKAGSQWIFQVLATCAPNRIIPPNIDLDQFYKTAIVPGAIYPTIYVPYPSFKKVLMPDLVLDPKTYQPSSDDGSEIQNWFHFQVKQMPVRKFAIIRDLRDTIISLYFSVKVSHALLSENLIEGRRQLSEMSLEEGLLQVLRTRGKVQANIQRSWLPVCRQGDALLIRYEDLIADEQGMFAKIMDYCKINVSKNKLEKIVEKSSFSSLTGRKPGEENIASHYRKGISGDWKNYFTDRVKAEFKEQFGQLLIDTGYEKDLNW